MFDWEAMSASDDGSAATRVARRVWGRLERSVVARLVGITLAVGAVLFVVDRSVGSWLGGVETVSQPVDIQSPAMLFAKLDELRRFEGYKVAVLGDSLVFGRSLAEHGDADWRDHHLAAQLQDRLAAETDEPVLVMNLGINGALPADLERLAAMLDSCDVDLVLFNIGLRAFSRDFSAEDAVHSRDWIARMEVDADGRYRAHPDDDTYAAWLESSCTGFLVNHSRLYRLRDYLQYRCLDSQPREFATRARTRLDDWAAGRSDAPDGDDDDLMVMMQARARLASVDFAEDNVQRRALERTLARLDANGTPAVVFFSRENAEELEWLLDEDTHHALVAELGNLIESAKGATFVGPLDGLRPEHYLDLVHVDRDGLAVYADALHPHVRAHRLSGDPTRIATSGDDRPH